MIVSRFIAVFSVLFVSLAPICPSYGYVKEESIAKKLSKEFRAVIKKTAPAVVSIRATLSAKRLAASGPTPGEEFPNTPEELWRHFFEGPGAPHAPDCHRHPAIAQASGFLIAKDGYLVTNNHVIQDAESVTCVMSDGKEYSAKVVGVDPNTDVALLKIEGKDFPFLQFANSDEIDVGDLVLTIGNPLGLRATVTSGIVSAKGRNELDIARIEEFVQTDAPINHGNSGGALLDMDGQVIGMNTAIATPNGGNIGIGFAIPSNLIKHVVDELAKNGKVVRGFLGVTLQKVEGEIAAAFGLNNAQGALVTDIIKDGPADKAGLKPGDIILKLNDHQIDTVGTLRNVISFMQPGESALLSILRDGKEVSLKVTVGTHPENEIAAQEVENNFGLVVQELTPEIASELGYKDDQGVLIKYVAPNSMAQYAGLRRGQLILSVNKHVIRSPEEFYQALRARTSGSQVLLHVKEGQVTRFVILRME